MSRKSVQHTFAMLPKVDIQRSRFDRSFRHLTTFDEGLLVPILVDEVLPGDTFSLKLQLLIRMTTPIVPFMDNLFVDTHFFFVPTRLVWKNFQKFMGEQEDPGDSTDYLIPKVSFTNVQSMTLPDYMGIPIGVTNALTVDATFFRAYNLIWNQWFRDENLQDSVTVKTDDGPDDPSIYQLLRRGKRRDYFTSCLPWPQKGPATEIGLTGMAPVVPISTGSFGSSNWQATAWNGKSYYFGYGLEAGTQGDNESPVVSPGNQSGMTLQEADSLWNGRPGYSPSFGNIGTATPIATVLDGATAVSINNLRQAFQIQKFLERNARGGTRYVELLRNHFGVQSPDARLQRPEYLGGGSSRIHVNAVPQTSSTDTTSPQGNLAAFAVTGDTYHGFTKSFVEHGILIGLMSVRAPLTYQQGINRMYLKNDLYDMYFPTFAHLGEEAVLNKEIFAQGTSADNDVFGYQERYGYHRYKPDMVTGKFRSQDPQSLDVWHLAQDYQSLPLLNSTFIEENAPVERVLAVQNEPHFMADTFFKYKCVRPMPVYSVPGLVDHF